MANQYDVLSAMCDRIEAERDTLRAKVTTLEETSKIALAETEATALSYFNQMEAAEARLELLLGMLLANEVSAVRHSLDRVTLRWRAALTNRVLQMDGVTLRFILDALILEKEK